jgi:hypothetical protein
MIYKTPKEIIDFIKMELVIKNPPYELPQSKK